MKPRPPEGSPLLSAPVGPTMLRMAAPMVLGMASVVLFNVVDTYFVGQLGALELAAMSFTFPPVFVIMSLSMGLSVATTSVISRAIGSGDRQQVRRLTTHALALANTVVALFCLAGLLTIDPLFRALGAGDDVLPLIRQYMVPWYIGVGFLVIPMVGNGAIRATGDTRTPSYLMMLAGGLNMVLDPVLIFGLGPLPRLELQGAALATVIARSMTFFAALWILSVRERMLDLSLPSPAQLWDSWRRVLHIGGPATGAKLLVPLSTGVLTRMVSGYGPHAVAGFGVGQRMESLVLIGVGALSAAATPLVGQNFGAGNCERVKETLAFGVKVALIWGAGVAALLALAAVPLASAFNDQPEVVAAAVSYMWIVPVSYSAYGVALLVIEVFNAVNRPLRAVAIIGVRLFVLAIPMAWAGSLVWGTPGVFAGISASNVLVGLLASLLAWRLFSRFESDADASLKAAPG